LLLAVIIGLAFAASPRVLLPVRRLAQAAQYLPCDCLLLSCAHRALHSRKANRCIPAW
jgi:hypothetical protein